MSKIHPNKRILCLASSETTNTVRNVAHQLGMEVKRVKSVQQVLNLLTSSQSDSTDPRSSVSSVPNTFCWVVAALGTRPANKIFDLVGDRSRVINAAKALGCRMVVFSHTACRRSDYRRACEDAGADIVLCDGTTLSAFFQGGCGSSDEEGTDAGAKLVANDPAAQPAPTKTSNKFDRKRVLVAATSVLSPGARTNDGTKNDVQNVDDASVKTVALDAIQTKASQPPSEQSVCASISETSGAAVKSKDKDTWTKLPEPYEPIALREKWDKVLDAAFSLTANDQEAQKYRSVGRRLARLVAKVSTPLTFSLTSGEGAQAKTTREGLVRFVHVSDTHHHHETVTLPAGDVLLHTGDAVGNYGKQNVSEHFTDFLKWINKVAKKYKHVVFIAGNHDIQLDATG